MLLAKCGAAFYVAYNFSIFIFVTKMTCKKKAVVYDCIYFTLECHGYFKSNLYRINECI